MLPKKRFLIVEDNECQRPVLTKLVESVFPGCQSVVHERSDKALMHVLSLERLKLGREFDLAILDISTPGVISGIELFKFLNLLNPNLKAILISAQQPIEFAKLLGNQANPAPWFYAKPIEPLKLGALVKRVLRES